MRKLLIAAVSVSLSLGLAGLVQAAAKDDAKAAPQYTLDANGKCKNGNKFAAQKNCASLKPAPGAKTTAPAMTAAAPAKSGPATTPATSAAAPVAPATKAAKTPAAPKSKSSATIAPAPANAPAGATAVCNDGSFSMNKTHSGSCSRHGGVKTFFK